jgi:DNA-directed RNA polymerase
LFIDDSFQTPLEITSPQTTSEGAADDESATSQREHWVPFNLSNLRKHLAQVALARRVLPEDVASRQKLLEESVFDVAVERWKHEEEVFESMGFGNSGLKHADLQAWMWDWHQKLKKQLQQEIQEVSRHENELRAYLLFPFIVHIRHLTL